MPLSTIAAKVACRTQSCFRIPQFRIPTKQKLSRSYRLILSLRVSNAAVLVCICPWAIRGTLSQDMNLRFSPDDD